MLSSRREEEEEAGRREANKKKNPGHTLEAVRSKVFEARVTGE